MVLWLPVAIVRLTWLLVTRRVEFVLTGDAPMHAVVRPLTRLFRRPTATMILGLDVTFESPLYRRLVVAPLRWAEHVIAISAATRDAAIAAGVAPERISVIRLGVDAPNVDRERRLSARRRVTEELSVPEGSRLLLTLGRLVRRKGVRWFTEKVLPELPANVHYVVAGDGPERQAVSQAARSAGVLDRVHILGSVDDARREALMAGCDVFVQPNISVPGDMEGFGLVTVEAAMRGTPVLAADLEGIKDAVIPDVTGVLLPSEDAQAWREKLCALLGELDELRAIGARFQEEARDRFGEERMGRELIGCLGLVERS